jgi:hypothetical protein
MTVALVLFAIAALGGLILAVLRLRGRADLPLGLAVVHGLVAAAGLVALIVAIAGATAAGGLAKGALVLFIIAALGGFALITSHLRTKNVPIPLMIVHAVVAVVAFVLLLVNVVGA